MSSTPVALGQLEQQVDTLNMSRAGYIKCIMERAKGIALDTERVSKIDVLIKDIQLAIDKLRGEDY